MLTTLASLRRLEAQVSLSVNRADPIAQSMDAEARRRQARQLSVEAAKRLAEVSQKLNGSLDTIA